MTTYYSYDPEHGVFEDQTEPLKYIDPKKVLSYLFLGVCCWTDFEECQKAVAGVLNTKISVLSDEFADTQRMLRESKNWTSCDDCEEVLHDDDVHTHYPTRATELILCERCITRRHEDGEYGF